MSRQYDRCSICGDLTQISDTNCDIDLGFRMIKGRIVCLDCIEELT